MHLDNLSGMQIREYRVIEKLGQGGMATVFKVEHVLLRTFRAMKVIRPVKNQDAQYVLRFEREARVLVSLDHINLVRVYDFFQEEGCLFLIMEYVPGESMEVRLRRTHVFSARDVIEILSQACEGLHVAHQAGIVHRDLAPDNLLIMPLSDGCERIKVIDFGIAKDVTESQTDGLTVMGKFVGKLAYCSPEQAAGNALDQRSDIYSLGLVAHRALTGRIPFHPKSPFEALALRQVQDAPTLSESRPDGRFPDRLEAAVARALKRDPRERFQRVLEFRDALRDVMGECEAANEDTQFRTTSKAAKQIPGSESLSDRIEPDGTDDRTIEGQRAAVPIEVDLDRLETSVRDFPWGIFIVIALAVAAFVIGWYQISHYGKQAPTMPIPPTISVSSPTHTMTPEDTETPLPTMMDTPTMTPEPLPETLPIQTQSPVNTRPEPTTADSDRTLAIVKATAEAEKARWVSAPTDVPLARIAHGAVVIGSDPDEPGRRDDESVWAVGISRDYQVSVTEVTQAQYLAVMGHNPSRNKGPDYPVESVTWFDALRFCNALSIKQGIKPAYEITKDGDSIEVSWLPNSSGYRLPTEAEWETAARAGRKTPFTVGGRLTQGHANFDNPSGIKTVRCYEPNAAGIYDVEGNVREWCWDGYGEYGTEPVTDPSGQAASSRRVVRGGSFRTKMEGCRLAGRDSEEAGKRSDDIGFRVVRNP